METPLLAKGTGGDPHSYAALVPMGRIGQPDEIADPVVFLLSEEARYITSTRCPSMVACALSDPRRRFWSGRQGLSGRIPKAATLLFVDNRLEGSALGTTEAVIAGLTL